MLGALAMVAVGFLFTSPASAALPGAGTHNNVTCSAFADTSGRYPTGYFYKCISSTQKTNAVWGTVSGEPEVAVRDNLESIPITYYVFRSQEEYEDYFTGAGLGAYDPGAGAHGFSTFGSDPYVVVFEGYESGGVFIPFSSLSMANTAAHESGHHLDYKWGPAVFGYSHVSNSDVFDDMLAHDIYLLDHMKQGQNWVTRPPCGSNGALINLHDPAQGGQPVCTGQQLDQGYSGTNWEIVQDVLPYYFTEYSGLWSELVAESFADVSANSVSATSGDNLSAGAADAILSDEFVCVRSLMSSLRLRADEPPIYPTNCTITLP